MTLIIADSCISFRNDSTRVARAKLFLFSQQLFQSVFASLNFLFVGGGGVGWGFLELNQVQLQPDW